MGNTRDIIDRISVQQELLQKDVIELGKQYIQGMPEDVFNEKSKKLSERFHMIREVVTDLKRIAERNTSTSHDEEPTTPRVRR